MVYKESLLYFLQIKILSLCQTHRKLILIDISSNQMKTSATLLTSINDVVLYGR